MLTPSSSKTIYHVSIHDHYQLPVLHLMFSKLPNHGRTSLGQPVPLWCLGIHHPSCRRKFLFLAELNSCSFPNNSDQNSNKNKRMKKWGIYKMSKGFGLVTENYAEELWFLPPQQLSCCLEKCIFPLHSFRKSQKDRQSLQTPRAWSFFHQDKTSELLFSHLLPQLVSGLHPFPTT